MFKRLYREDFDGKIRVGLKLVKRLSATLKKEAECRSSYERSSDPYIAPKSVKLLLVTRARDFETRIRRTILNVW